MKFSYEDKNLEVQPMEFDKNSSKEILQYAVGGLLYMPGTNLKVVEDIIAGKLSHATSICLCLEDAIGDDMVKKSETCVKEILRKLHTAIHDNVISISDIPLIFVRVREPEQIERLYKLAGNKGFSVLCGFNLPKFDKTNCDFYLSSFDAVRLQCPTPLYIMPIIESKNVMYRQRRMDQLIYLNDRLFMYSDYVLNVRVGATDFCSLFGIRRSMEGSVYDMNVIADCLADVVNMFARNYVCSGPVWEFFDSDGVPGKWSEGLKRELFLDKLNGFIGKTCIHPSQLKYIQESNIVTYEQYKDATSILGMSDGLIGVKKGYNNNKMNEVKTHSYWARKILGLSQIYGVLREGEVI